MEDFVSKTSKLLDKEREAEIEESRAQTSKKRRGDENCIILEIDSHTEQESNTASAENSPEYENKTDNDVEIIPVDEDEPSNEPAKKKARSEATGLQMDNMNVPSTNVQAVSTEKSSEQPDSGGVNIGHFDLTQQPLYPTTPFSVGLPGNPSSFSGNLPTNFVNNIVPNVMANILYNGQINTNLFAPVGSQAQMNMNSLTQSVEQAQTNTNFLAPGVSILNTNLLTPTVSQMNPILVAPTVPQTPMMRQPHVINIVPDEVLRAEAQATQQRRPVLPGQQTGQCTITPHQITGKKASGKETTTSCIPTAGKKKAKRKRLGNKANTPFPTMVLGKRTVNIKELSNKEKSSKPGAIGITDGAVLTCADKTNFPPSTSSIQLGKPKTSKSPSVNQIDGMTVSFKIVEKSTSTPSESDTPAPTRVSFKPKNFLKLSFKSPKTGSDKQDNEQDEANKKAPKPMVKKKTNTDNKLYTTKKKDNPNTDRRKSDRRKKNRKFDDCVLIRDEGVSQEDDDSENDLDSLGSSVDSVCHTCHSEEPPLEFEKGMDMEMFELKWVDCDQCHLWYHWFCVGIYEEDETKYFKCHTCKNR